MGIDFKGYEIINGLRIYVDENCGRFEWRQYRFPRSKKKRTQKKWAKKFSRKTLVEPWCYRMPGGILMHPVIYEQFKQQIVRDEDLLSGPGAGPPLGIFR